ncbi:MAG: hypothetical protein ACRELF_13445 [Gemmataceae bacterium]
MRMRRHVTSRSLRFRNCWLVLAVLVTLLLSFPGSAAPPDKVQVQVIPPIEIKPIQLAALTLTAPCTPRIGPWSALSVVYAGANPDEPVWGLRGEFSTKAGRINFGAKMAFLSGFGPPATTPLTELTMLLACEQRDCWELINTDEVRPFPKYFLADIRDRRGIFNGDLEYEGYWQVLVQSHYTSAKAFARAARRDLTYVHLFNEPERYRGQVVHVAGRLMRHKGRLFLAFPAPMEARAAGVGTLYEAWIKTDAFGENPVCVAFTDLPDGLNADDARQYDGEVGFDGYFYKRYRYKATDSRKANEFRDAPLLVGHSLVGRFGGGAAVEESENWGQNLIWMFLGVVGVALVGVIVLTAWFRIHDRRVRYRLSASRNQEFVPPFEEEGFLPESANGID